MLLFIGLNMYTYLQIKLIQINEVFLEINKSQPMNVKHLNYKYILIDYCNRVSIFSCEK